MLGSEEMRSRIAQWEVCFLLFFVFSFFFLIPFGKFGPSYLGKATAAARAALPSPTCVRAGSCSVSLIHRMLTWTTGSLTCVRDHSYECVYIHTGVGHIGDESAQHFWLGKLSQIVIVLLTGMGFEPPVFGSRVRCSTNWATPSPNLAVPKWHWISSSLFFYIAPPWLTGRWKIKYIY